VDWGGGFWGSKAEDRGSERGFLIAMATLKLNPELQRASNKKKRPV